MSLFSNGNKFPSFDDGDVLIVLSKKNMYKLHSNVIRRSAPVMGALLTENNAAKLNPKARKTNNALRWRVDLEIELDRNGNFGDCYFGSGEVDQNGQTRPVGSEQDTRARKLHPSVFENYDNLFKIIYQEPVDYGTGLLMTLKTCMGIIAVGDAVGALKSISKDLERVFLQNDKHLWKSVFQQPVMWVNLAVKLQSTVIFKDAMTHLVGKWRLISSEERMLLIEPAKKACLSVLLDFQRKKQAIEVRMLGHYPVSLRKSGELENIKKGASGNPSRSVYANDIYGWMALDLFRQWLSQIGCSGANFRAKDGGCLLYKALSVGGNAYLKEFDLENFYRHFPMSDKAHGVIENHIILIKEDMKRFVAPLLLNNTHYTSPEPLPYLLSADISDEDCPWVESGDSAEENVTMEDLFPDLDENMAMLDVPAHFGAESPLAARRGISNQQQTDSWSNLSPGGDPSMLPGLPEVNVRRMLHSVGASSRGLGPSTPTPAGGSKSSDPSVCDKFSFSNDGQGDRVQSRSTFKERENASSAEKPSTDSSNSIARAPGPYGQALFGSEESTIKYGESPFLATGGLYPIGVRHRSFPRVKVTNTIDLDSAKVMNDENNSGESSNAGLSVDQDSP